jgi:ankyrin repeat protein
MVQLLIDAKANLQSRNIETGIVPLHCAAKYGNLEVVKLLLKHKVPHMPRSSDGELPVHFAQEKHHNEVAEYLRNYVPNVETFRDKWYHGTLGRNEAQRMLQNYADELYKKLKSENAQVPVDTIEENMYENQNKEVSFKFYISLKNYTNTTVNLQKDILTSGTFLVRTSERNNWSYVITMLFENQTKNYVIQKFVSHIAF